MYIDKYKTEYGDYVDDAGAHWDHAEEFLQGLVCDFCCCGDPEASLRFIADGLAFIDYRINTKDAYATVEQAMISIFGSPGGAYFFFYWANKEGFAEHGSSVPGWLTDKGKHLLSDIKELYAI